MRYGIFSDVHGNIEALDAVLGFFSTAKIDRYAFLGDAVGYGANPEEVCTRIRELDPIAVMGNHDAAVAGKMSYEDYYDAARHALDWCKARLSEENLSWLANLPYKERVGDVEFCHGAPVAPETFDYLFSADQAMGVLRGAFDQLAPVTFIGHSHLTISFRIFQHNVEPVIESEVHCEPGASYIITDGSVGQPRDRDPRACCGIYDTESRIFGYHRIEYDIFSQRRKILEAGLAPVFGDRLLAGM